MFVLALSQIGEGEGSIQAIASGMALSFRPALYGMIMAVICAVPALKAKEAQAGPQFKVYVSGYETSPYQIEWMRFEQDSPLPELVKAVPHVAFEVDDLDAAIAGQEVLIPPNSPSEGVRVAFIIHNGAPVELLEIRGRE
jgi:hypothetical protein